MNCEHRSTVCWVYTQVLLQDREVRAEHEKSLRTIESSGRHLLSLINDILDLTKIESSQIELHPAAMDLRETLADVRNMLQEKANSKGLTLQVDVQSKLPAVIVADEIKLRQVLLNLMSNGVKYTRSGWVKCRLRKTLNVCTLLLKIPALVLMPRVCNECLNLSGSFKSGYMAGGTGLGLAISRHLVAAMGGELTVSSEVGTGSCFEFEINMEEGNIGRLGGPLPSSS